MEELGSINEEIKSVKTEVKEKQKRLSKFTVVLEELPRGLMVSGGTNVGQDFPENSQFPKEN